MKKILKFILLGLLIGEMVLPVHFLAANTCTVANTGNWSTPATWANSGGCDGATNYPGQGAGDTAIINGAKTVTLDVSPANGVILTLGSTTTGNLILGDGYTLTLAGASQCFVNSTLTWDRSSTLDLNGQTLTLGRCGFARTNSTGKWAWVTDTATGGIITSLVTSDGTNAKQSIVLDRMTFLNTGIILLPLWGTNGTLTNQLILDHIVFYGNGQITFGSSTNTGTLVQVTNSDFVDTTGTYGPYIKGASGAMGVGSKFQHNTVYHSTTWKAGLFNSVGMNVTGLLVQDNIISNFEAFIPVDATAVKYNFFDAPNASAGAVLLNIDTRTGDVGVEASYNYFYPNYSNSHTQSYYNTSAGSLQLFHHNVFENTFAYADNGHNNYFAPSKSNGSAYNNIFITPANGLVNNNPSTSTGTLNMKNNTLYVTNNAQVITGIFYLNETQATAFGGTVNIANNLIAYATGVAAGVNCRAYRDETSLYDAITYSGYNILEACATWASNATIVSQVGDTASVTAGSSKFVDPTRNIAKWDASLGGAGTFANAKANLLLINGYNSAVKDQSTAIPIGYNVKNLVEWVSYGFSPTNGTLRKAGDPADSSPTIGAMEWQNPRRKRAM